MQFTWKEGLQQILCFWLPQFWQREVLEQCLAMCQNWWQLKQRMAGFLYCSQLYLPKISILSINNFELISEWQDMLMMGSGFRFTDERNLLIFEFWLNFLSTTCLLSSVEIKGFMFFMTTFVELVWVRSFVQELPGEIFFISFSNVSDLFCFFVDGHTTFWKSVGVLNFYLFTGEFLNSLFSLCWTFGS